MTKIILPTDSTLYQTFQEIVTQRRIAILVGLPGTGKSLLVKQLALMAQQAGRTVHMLQYDVARLAFETPKNLAKYPEIDGFTHAALRKGVGLWARQGALNWSKQFTDPQHFLVGEIPMVGNRLSELTYQLDDEAEALLAGDETIFVLPVPSKEVRQVIEAAREKTIAQPRHKKEEKDAQPNVLYAIWAEMVQVGHILGFVDKVPSGTIPYDPAVYTAVFQHLLTHRQSITLNINTALKPQGSAYDLTIKGTELAATAGEVDAIIAAIEKQYTPESLEKAVAQWYEV